MSVTIEVLAQRIETLEKQMADLLSDKKKAEKKEKKEKKKSKDTDDDEPKKKKAPSGYLLFSKATRQEAKESSLKIAMRSPKSTEIMKKLGAMWKELDEDERESWNEKAKELKDKA